LLWHAERVKPYGRESGWRFEEETRVDWERFEEETRVEWEMCDSVNDVQVTPDCLPSGVTCSSVKVNDRPLSSSAMLFSAAIAYFRIAMVSSSDAPAS
jgi:hypothetical protein